MSKYTCTRTRRHRKSAICPDCHISHVVVRGRFVVHFYPGTQTCPGSKKRIIKAQMYSPAPAGARSGWGY